MRFISRAPAYVFTGQKATKELRNADGELVREGSEPFFCRFQQGATTAHEREVARKTFKFQGVALEQSSPKQVDPIHRVSVYDTATDPELQADPELRKAVEERLLSWQGIEDHILVETEKLSEPWVGYDRLTSQGRRTNEMVAEKIAARVTEDGYTGEEIDAVLAYERALLNREEVITALTLLRVPDEVVAA